MNITEVSQAELFRIAEQRGNRVGSTKNPDARAGAYSRDGYRGEMFVARTNNMMKAEDRLLGQSDYRHNVQRYSNAQEKPGYIYTNVGQKRN